MRRPMLYTETQMEAAQCIWEAVLEDFRNDGVAEEVRGMIGTAELRYQLRSLDILKACEDGWFILERLGVQEKMIPYDWEYVPWFVWNCLDWDVEEGSVSLKSNWEEIVVKIKEK